MYVNEYASGTQQQYYTTNESYSTTGNHQSETYIVPVEEALLTNQSRESPQALSAVSYFLFSYNYMLTVSEFLQLISINSDVEHIKKKKNVFEHRRREKTEIIDSLIIFIHFWHRYIELKVNF